MNKTESAVELMFDLGHSLYLTDAERMRAMNKLGGYLDSNGLMRVVAQSERSQLRNREEAIARFAALLREALVIPKKRRPTKPSRRAKEKRLTQKKQVGAIKKGRQQRIQAD